MVFLLVCFFPRGIECISSVLSFVFVYRLVIVDYLAAVSVRKEGWWEQEDEDGGSMVETPASVSCYPRICDETSWNHEIRLE